LVPQLLHHNNNPAGGVVMLCLCAYVILGGKNPFVVELTSNCADALGVLVPTPTCAWVKVVTTNSKKKMKIDFFEVCMYFNYISSN
jgi:hypothetical protein